YKSEFLANMSHELRTPLNSLLLLSQSLASNKLKNLSEEQVEDLNVIHNSGQSLLSLINDILDLSKVEAGKLTIVVEDTPLSDLTERLRKQFKAEAEKRDLAFQVHLHDDVVGLSIQTDKHRLEQILRNLLSNAFKFTRAGEVSLAVSRTADGVVFHVTDTGIGVSAEQQKVIFDAFQQADGSTSRAYGGTGLGLTISRELASRLGGEITIDSELCRGSTFSLGIPLRAPASAPEIPLLRESKGVGRSQTVVASADTLRNERTAGSMPVEKPLLIVEDDADFAQTLSRLAIQGGFTPHVAASGMDALMKVMALSPVGIVLDVGLPDTDGLQVLEALTSSPVTRQIPVHIVSGREDIDIETLRRGAIGFLRKPAALDELKVLFARFETLLQRGIKHVLVIDDGTSFREINQSLNLSDLQVHVATTPEAAFDLLHAEPMDCCILDLDLGNFDGLDFLKAVDADSDLSLPPVIVYTEDTLSEVQFNELKRYSDRIVLKGRHSPAQLSQEVTLFLRSIDDRLPPSIQSGVANDPLPPGNLEGRKVLVVDDDLRNSYALSKVLREHGVRIVMADNGQLALEKLLAENDVDLILMDIMMPVMDGYEAMQRIRADISDSIPIIALTAKAMADDRRKCIEAGANDYMAKPVNMNSLMSMMKVWLYH
ncbi:MAG: response regulator, partial [Pseudomonadales bacterium]|nr:response regulator [Pseudomonadales bacterium]